MIVVVPMAGRGSRMAGYGLPKPLVPVAGRPMVGRALASLDDVAYHTLVFVALREHEARYGVSELLREISSRDAEVVLLPEVTEGQLCTVLAAREFIDVDEDVLVASSDTLVVSDLGRDIACRNPEVRGIISVADVPGDCWSFARTDDLGRVVEVAEKVRISGHASTGLYYFASGRELVRAGDALIGARETTRGEYYLMPVYRKYLEEGRSVTLSYARDMWDMGTPEAKAAFESRWARRSAHRPLATGGWPR